MEKITFAITTKIDNHEREQYLHECIESIIQQKNNNWIVLISDDNSGLNVDYQRYADNEQIIVFKQKNNLGMFNGWNFLLHQCTTKFFIPMGDDDIVKNSFVGLCLESFSKNKEVDCLYFDIDNINSKGHFQKKVSSNMKQGFHKKGKESLNYRAKNSLNFSYTFFVSVVKTKKLQKLGGYKDYGTITDTYMSYLIAENCNVFYIKDSIMQIRKHKDNASNNIKRIFKEQKKLIPVLINDFGVHLSKDNIEYLNYLKKTTSIRFIKAVIIRFFIRILNIFGVQK